ncbi:hypothetical protein [Echinicola sp. 20G]|uniref:hypothetical protein n=1 Tax=Echinicola sp. 20G TaxID=2781961 RepID=UPI001910A801|nr:hypothetical protein [Echinicola sp. 20G]
MKINTLNIKKGTKYLSNALNNQLPINCIFDKGKVGAGGTTIALTNQVDYIVCVPYRSLIDNKIEQSKSNALYPYPILSVQGGANRTTSAEIKDYIRKNSVRKIMVTYDSLPRLFEILDRLGLVSSFNLLIDEYHLLFTNYVFRDKAVKGVLDLFRKFKSYTFMTATVLEDEFLLDELKGVRKVVVEWEEVAEVNIRPVQAKNGVIQSTITMVERFLRGELKGNAYIFVNSLDFVRKVIKSCGLTEENTRLIYSESNKARLPIKRGKTTDKPKKIQFITSTAFEGADFYDKEGRIIIISDPSKSHTLVDISTSLQQIAGRIRDTKFIDEIWHLYSHTRYDESLSYDEYRDKVNQNINAANELVMEYNGLSQAARRPMNVDADSHYFYKGEDNFFVFDPNRVKLDLYNFKITHHLYKTRVSLSEEYKKNGLKLDNYYLDESQVVVNTDDLGTTFKDVALEVKAVWNDHFNSNRIDIINGAFAKYQFLNEAIDRLGFEGLKEQGYMPSNIKRKLVSTDLNTSLEVKVMERLQLEPSLKSGCFVPANKLKSIFSYIYKELKIKKTAKGTDIEAYFDGKFQTKKINGKAVKGYIVNRQKIVIG